MSDTRASYGASLAFSVASFMSMGVVGLASSVVLARLFGVVVIGQYALVLSVSLFVLLLSTLREQVALVRDLSVLPARDPRVTGRFYAVLAFSLGLATVVGAIAFVIAALLFRGPLDQPGIVGAMAAMIVGHVLLEKPGWNLDMLLTAFRAARELFWLRLLQAVSLVSFAIILGAVGHHSLTTLVVATIASWAIALIGRLVVAGRFMRWRVDSSALRDGFRQLPRYLRFGLKASGAAVGSIGRLMPTWVLAWVGSIATVGAYNRAEMITQRITEGSWRVTEMLFPTMVERYKAGDRTGFDRSLIDTVRYMVVALLGLAAAVGGAAVGVMEIFGPGFDAAANALVLLMLLPAYSAVVSSQEQAMYAVNRPGVPSLVEIARLLATVGMTISLGVAFGATGVALGLLLSATLAGLIYGAVLRGYLEASFTRFWPPRELAALLIAYLVGFLVAHTIDGAVHAIWGTVVALIVGAISFAVAFTLAGGINRRDRTRFAESVAPRLARLGLWRAAPAAADEGSGSLP